MSELDPHCDGDEFHKCTATPTLQCACSRCLREHDPRERFHTCADFNHEKRASEFHYKVRGRQPKWAGFVGPDQPPPYDRKAPSVGSLSDPAMPSRGRIAWLINPVSSAGRLKIDVAQYEELRAYAIRLRKQLSDKDSTKGGAS
jgi:hypothetical protein